MPKIRPTTREEAVSRARSQIGGPIRYQLLDHNGGRDPFAPDPATHWVDDHNEPEASCDCAGFVAWCLGYDRYQRGKFNWWDGWINVDSAIYDAKYRDTHGPTTVDWFELVDSPLPGDLIAYPSTHKNGVRHVGHVGIVTSVSPLLVTHCSRGNDRRTGRAIQETDASIWEKRSDSVFLRYLRYEPYASVIMPPPCTKPSPAELAPAAVT